MIVIKGLMQWPKGKVSEEYFRVLRTQIFLFIDELDLTEEQADSLIALIRARVREPVFFHGKEIVYDDPNRPGAAPGEKRRG